jgi:nucleoside-diphosphate-sugar epimerase
MIARLRKAQWSRMVADVLLVLVALAGAFLANMFRLLGLGERHWSGFLWYPDPPRYGDVNGVARDALAAWAEAALWIVPIALLVFHLNGFYRYGRTYRGRFKALVLLQAASAVFALFAALSYLFTLAPDLPRMVYVLAWAGLVLLLWASRLWSAVWKDAVRTEEVVRRQRVPVPGARVLVVGGAGYIGSILVRRLLEKGYQVKVLDSLVYGDGAIRDLYGHANFQFVKGDSRSVEAVVSALRDVDAVIHLGAIVGDSACAIDDTLTIEINIAATRMLAEVAKGNGVRRFVFASTCSVYGASDDRLDEQSALNPVSLYARSKIACEEVLLGMADPDFCPVIMRLATIHGMSPRPRFDLVVNLLAAKAVTEGEFTIFGGDQWRPFVHVADAAEAFIRGLETDEALVHGEVFNIGADSENYRIRQIGELITELVPGARMKVDGEDTDRRNYYVRFDKAVRALKLRPRRTVHDGIAEIIDAVRSGQISDYRDAAYNNFRYLSETAVRNTMHMRQSIFAISGGKSSSAAKPH